MVISVTQLSVLLLIIGRLGGVFIQAPLFSSRSIPMFTKTAMVIWIAMVLWFVTPIHSPLPPTPFAFVLALVSEVAIGFLIGFICNMIFLAVQAAGEIIDLQMGLSVASALDPVFGSVISVIGRLTFYLAIIIFIAANGHHLILSALHQSFTALPAGKFANFTSPILPMQLIALGTTLWVTAFKLAAPVVLLIFLSDFSFGIVSRVAPQVNVFMLGFQVKPAIGLIGLVFCMPFIAKYIVKLVELMAQQMIILVNALK